MNVEETLKNYLLKNSRIMYLEIQIDKAKKELEIANQPYVEPERDVIESLQISAVTINPDKPAPTNKFSSATENSALNYERELEYKNEFDTFGIKRDIKKWGKELLEVKNEVREIDAAMKALTKEEQFIIQCKYFNEMYWRTIERDYELNFKIFKDEKTLCRIMKKAIEKMEKVVA